MHSSFLPLFPQSISSPFAMAIMMVCAVMVPLLLMTSGVYGEPQVPCYFVFGNSYYDTGNNNFLPTTTKANYYPYGIDFPGGVATGRFTNGNNTGDFLTKILGFGDSIPAYFESTGQSILNGLNYASGGSGIRAETGSHTGIVIGLDIQLIFHQIIVERIAVTLGSKEAAFPYLNKCLYTVDMGINDYVNNYYMPEHYDSSSQYTLEEYSQDLIERYRQQLTALHGHGARKVAVFGIPQIGCSPTMIFSKGTNYSECADSVNDAVLSFNKKLSTLVDYLNVVLEGASFLTVNTYNITSISSIGLQVKNASCCETTPGAQLCTPLGTPCSDRDEYLWWDGIHQTQVVNELVANRSYNAQSPSDTHPIDIHHLVTKS